MGWRGATTHAGRLAGHILRSDGHECGFVCGRCSVTVGVIEMIAGIAEVRLVTGTGRCFDRHDG